MTTPYQWPSREEWAIQRRTLYLDEMSDISVPGEWSLYASPEETAKLIEAFKEDYKAKGKQMRVLPDARKNGEMRARVRTAEITDEEMERLNLQRDRQRINRAIKLISKNRMPRLYDEGRYLKLVAPFIERYDKARDEAVEQATARRAQTPIDDAAWEAELRWRASFDKDGPFHISTGSKGV
jgi:hypothetical protein